MSPKKAASMKPVKKKSVSDDRTPEEYFDEAKLGLLAIVDSYERNAARPDNVVKDYASVVELGCERVQLACDMVKARKETYSKVRGRLDAMSFDSIMADDWEDPFADMLEYVDVDSTTISFENLMVRWAAFDAVRPFGEKVEQLRMTLLEKSGKSE